MWRRARWCSGVLTPSFSFFGVPQIVRTWTWKQAMSTPFLFVSFSGLDIVPPTFVYTWELGAVRLSHRLPPLYNLSFSGSIAVKTINARVLRLLIFVIFILRDLSKGSLYNESRRHDLGLPCLRKSDWRPIDRVHLFMILVVNDFFSILSSSGCLWTIKF